MCEIQSVLLLEYQTQKELGCSWHLIQAWSAKLDPPMLKISGFEQLQNCLYYDLDPLKISRLPSSCRFYPHNLYSPRRFLPFIAWIFGMGAQALLARPWSSLQCYHTKKGKFLLKWKAGFWPSLVSRGSDYLYSRDFCSINTWIYVPS